MVSGVSESDPGCRTLAWLLQPADPSARYLTLTRILGQGEDTKEVRASRAAIPCASPARDILRAQYPQGYWMHPGIGYSPRYRATLWQVLLLAQLGMARCPSLDRAVDHLFEVNQRGDGAFRASKEAADAPIALNGSLLWALEILGYGNVPQVTDAWSWLASEVEARAVTMGHASTALPTCAAVKVLWAANAVPLSQQDDAVRHVGQVAAAVLLDGPLDRASSDPRWSRLTFPLTQAADLLQWMEVLVGAGYGDDPRLGFARSWLTRKRCPDGAWPLERIPGKLWADFGEPGEANKWVTIRALTVAV